MRIAIKSVGQAPSEAVLDKICREGACTASLNACTCLTVDAADSKGGQINQSYFLTIVGGQLDSYMSQDIAHLVVDDRLDGRSG